MGQLQKFSAGLSLQKRITLGASALLVITALVLLVRWNKDRDFKPLYAELSAEDSGAIVAKLKEAGVEYKLRESDSAILVPASRIAELHMQMAAAGIPKSGRIGYELFDRTNLGTTDFSEQVNYHRAIEGEVERSVLAMAEVQQARVHITFPKDSIFNEDRAPAKASVMVKLRQGSHLSEQNAAAISQLVSSAVEGLAPEAVSVMDMRGNLLLRSHKPGGAGDVSDETLQYKDKLEKQVQAKINSVLDPLIGSAKYRTAVDMDVDLTSGEESSESFDPDHSVITSSQKNEEGSVGKDLGGVPGTQTNLPRPTTVRPPNSSNGLVRRTETLAYQTNRVVRRTKLPQGNLRRMSISVIVDQDLKWEMTGKGRSAHPQRTLTPPSPERLKSIQSIVAAAAGINTQRGDLLTVETQPFESTLNAEPPANMTVPNAAPPSKPSRFSPVVIGSIAATVLLIGLGALFFLKRQKAKAVALRAELQPAKTENALLGAEQAQNDETAAINGAKQPAIKSATEDLIALSMAPLTKTELLNRQVSEQAEKDPASLARIIRTWLNEPEEAEG